MSDTKTVQHTNMRFDPDLWREFKAETTYFGWTLEGRVSELIRRDVKTLRQLRLRRTKPRRKAQARESAVANP